MPLLWLILLFNFIWIATIFSSIRFDYSQLTAFWAASDFSLWFRFVFDFNSSVSSFYLSTFYTFCTFYTLFSYIFCIYLTPLLLCIRRILACRCFSLEILFIHSLNLFRCVTHAFVLPAAPTTVTTSREGDNNFYFGAFVVVLLRTKHFCFGAAATTRTEAPGTVTKTTRTTSTNCAHSSVISL